MSELSLEQDERIKTHTCDCCGRPYHSLHGFVYDDGNALAIYHAALNHGHDRIPNKVVCLAITIGQWDEASTQADRCAVTINVWSASDQIQMGFIDAAESMWRKLNLGTLLDRDQALSNPLKDSFFKVADFLILNDSRIRAFLFE